jgi:hypothetical protein
MLDAGGRQLDGQGQSVEAGADLGDGRGRGVGDGEVRLDGKRPLQEERGGWVARERRRIRRRRWQRKRRQRVFVLAAQVERLAARDQGAQSRALGKEVGHQWSGGGNLLEVVQQEQDALASQVGLEDFLGRARPPLDLAQIQRPGDGGGDERGVADGSEGDEEDAVAEVLAQLGGDM